MGLVAARAARRPAAVCRPPHGASLPSRRARARADWNRPTVAGAWTVRDVAAHLLDGDLRRLSLERDGQRAASSGRGLRERSGPRRLLERAERRVGEGGAPAQPRVLLELLKIDGAAGGRALRVPRSRKPRLLFRGLGGRVVVEELVRRGARVHRALAPPAADPPGRGRAALERARWLKPVIDLSMRALPHRYAGTTAPEGAPFSWRSADPRAETWSLVRRGDAWGLFAGRTGSPEATRISLDEDTAWRVFFKALPRDAPRPSFSRGAPTWVGPS